MQVPPSAPQAFLAPPARHAPWVEQQPAQLVPSQTQAPPWQWRPAPQACICVPHTQVPFAAQVSAFAGSQAVHAVPAAPHFSVERVWQTSFSQQPVGQVVAEQGGGPQTPARQVPLPHCTQAAPPVPQLFEAVPATQTPLAQQPVGQVVASQVAVTQPPSWQLSELQAAQL